MPNLFIDFETCSTADLKRQGAYKYAADPETQVLCLAYAFDREPVQIIDFTVPGAKPSQRILDHIADARPVFAWNAQFEMEIWAHHIDPAAPINWRCLMAQAAYHGLPLSLDRAAEALELPFGKDTDGHKLMMRMSRPRSHKTGQPPVWWHETDPQRLQRLFRYCKQDVEVERAIFHKTPMLPVPEQTLWKLDARMNARGVGVDLDLIDRLQKIVNEAMSQLDMEMKIRTKGDVPSTRAVSKLIEWLTAQGLRTDSVSKTVLPTLIEQASARWGSRSVPVYVLQVRQEAAKSSTAKLRAMKECAGPHDRMRGLIQYYGAFRTGRFAGRLAQPHNYPRPEIRDPENAIAYIKDGMTIDGVRDFWGSPLTVASACLRGCLVPNPKHRFMSLDFSQIEARVIAWLAGQNDILRVFARGEDVYQYTADKIGSGDRQLGKVLVLACGFGMGPAKFQDTAAAWGIPMSLPEAEHNVESWRVANQRIVKYWHSLNQTCLNVLAAPPNGRPVSVIGFPSYILISCVRDQDRTHLVLRLPSGRELWYRDAMIGQNRFGQPGVSYMGINQYSRKWERIETYGGKLAENVTQAVARDVMARAMVRLDRAALRLILTVHDELLLEIPDAGHAQTETIAVDIVKDDVPWAPGLPIACDFWTGDRYRKG